MIVCSTSCGWKGELRALDDHQSKECVNALVTCPNLCHNGQVKLLRKNLKHHLDSKCPKRKQACQKCGQMCEYQLLSGHKRNTCPKRQYSCPHCNKAGCYDERTTTHLKVCPKVKIECHKCSLQIFRCDNETHPLTCTHEPVNCKYYNIGCMERPLRKDSKRHEENAQLHLAIATDTVLQLKNTILLKNTITFKMTDFKNHKDTNTQFYSPHFTTSRSGYKLCVGVAASGWGDGEGTHVTIGAYLMKGDDDNFLTWPFTGTVTLELLNQLEDKNHHKKTATFPADHEASKRVVDGERATRGWGWPQFISHTDLDFKPLINRQYLKDNTLVFRVSADAPDHKPWLECTP